MYPLADIGCTWTMLNNAIVHAGFFYLVACHGECVDFYPHDCQKMTATSDSHSRKANRRGKGLCQSHLSPLTR